MHTHVRVSFLCIPYEAPEGEDKNKSLTYVSTETSFVILCFAGTFVIPYFVWSRSVFVTSEKKS